MESHLADLLCTRATQRRLYICTSWSLHLPALVWSECNSCLCKSLSDLAKQQYGGIQGLLATISFEICAGHGAQAVAMPCIIDAIMHMLADVTAPVLESGALLDRPCDCCAGVSEPDPEPRHLLWTHRMPFYRQRFRQIFCHALKGRPLPQVGAALL